MKEIVFDTFKSTLQEVSDLSNIVKKEKVSKQELITGLKKAYNLLFSSYSSLSIFAESVKSYISVGYKIVPFVKKEKKKISKIEAKIIYNKLLSIIQTELDENIVVPKESLILLNQVHSYGLVIFSASIDENLKKNKDDLKIDKLSLKELSSTLNKYFVAITEYIQDLLLYDVYIVFERPEITYTQEIVFRTDYKKVYIDKWLNCSVEFSDLIRNKRVDHWSEILELDLDSEHIQKIENHQEKLFNECVDSEVYSVFSIIEELPKGQRVQQIEKELKLIHAFFQGDLSKLTIKRLKKIINFSKPKKLILAYDEIKKSNYYSSIDYLVYDFNYLRRYTNYFVASFFIGYIKILEENLKLFKTEETVTLNKNNIIGTSSAKNVNIPLFENVITNKTKREYIYNILEFFGAINSERKSTLTQRKKGVLRGVVEALTDNKILPRLGLHKLCFIIAKDINLELKSKLDYHETAKKTHQQAKQYIKDNPLH